MAILLLFFYTLFLLLLLLTSSNNIHAYQISRSILKNSNNGCCRFCCRSSLFGVTDDYDNNDSTTDMQGIENDTIRVRIWRSLSSGEEMSLSQLSAAVLSQLTTTNDESRTMMHPQQREQLSQGDLRYHLKHVEKQARTLSNKSNEWRERRGLLLPSSSNFEDVPKRSRNKLRIHFRRDKKKRNQLYVRLG